MIRTQRLDNRPDPFQEFYNSLDRPSEAVLEAILTWGVLYNLLDEIDRVESVTLTHSLNVRAIAEAKIKTDKIDSHTLAQLLSVGGSGLGCNAHSNAQFSLLQGLRCQDHLTSHVISTHFVRM